MVMLTVLALLYCVAIVPIQLTFWSIDSSPYSSFRVSSCAPLCVEVAAPI